MILLTWVTYDRYIQQIMQISAIWNHQIDANLIYVALLYSQDINKAIWLLHEFKKWKFRYDNKQNYKKKINKFLKRRCCNHNINLFFIFFSNDISNGIKLATVTTVDICLPFVKKDKDIYTKNKNN
ncbi:hypothetical protein RFI_35576 [Reticulomyxa filosa]|uniref:Uncharacterized protein n=1 Tax=Reticulomyxa filosa TaxID=46433 RepID=X6LIW5_RETFI|nr:hypothetical protein RFI_35576 [Reticulomyxa filosa]|eukprot:ETO01863.1 hypothetical protein RFI_35576 [Reticulomyxa filosa]